MATYLAIHAVAHGHPAPGFNAGLFVVGGIALAVLVLTEPWLRARRPTFHITRPDSGTVVFRKEPAEIPVFARQRAAREKRKSEIELGWRAIRVGADTLAAYHRAQARVARISPSASSEWAEVHGQGLAEIKTEVGARWSEVISDLKAHGITPASPWVVDASGRPKRDGNGFPIYAEGPMFYDISVNFTGLDGDAMRLQAVGRNLLRKHGIDPDAASLGDGMDS